MENSEWDEWAEWAYKNNKRADNNEDRTDRFIKEVFESANDKRPAVIRNQGCDFTEKVLCYLEDEWGIILCDLSINTQSVCMDILDAMKAKGQNISNTAGRIAKKIKG